MIQDEEHTAHIELYARVIPSLPDSLVIQIHDFHVAFQEFGTSRLFSGVFEAELIGSHAKSSFRTVDDEPNIGTLRNAMSNFMDRILNIINYGYCRYHAISLENIVYRRNGQVEAIPIFPGWHELEAATQESRKIDLRVLLNLQLRDKQFSRSLSDLRNALANHDDTAFYSYRSIESIKSIFMKKGGTTNNDDAVGWESMRDCLRISEQFIRDIKLKADGQRHGEVSSMEAGERLEAMRRAWLIAGRYVQYSQSGEEGLGEDVPFLQ